MGNKVNFQKIISWLVFGLILLFMVGYPAAYFTVLPSVAYIVLAVRVSVAVRKAPDRRECVS